MMSPLDILRECMAEAGDDLYAGLAAADHILSGASIPLSNDIHNRAAQSILDRSLKEVNRMRTSAKRSLNMALRRVDSDNGASVLKFVDKYRIELARLLTVTNLVAILEGIREVSTGISSLLPSEPTKILFANKSTPTPPSFTLVPPDEDSIEIVHFHIIEEAVRELASKNILTREKFEALNDDARQKAFTVAGIEATEMLEKIRDALAENIQNGADYATFRTKVVEAVGEGTFLSEAHMELVFRANVQAAFSDGQAAILRNPAVRSAFPYSAYDAIHDDRVREDHLAMEEYGIQGTNIYRTDDPVFQLFRAPWSWNCRCSWTVMTVRQAAEAGIKEAQQWLDTGVEPQPPAWVKMPPFQPPDEFLRAAVPLSIQLSSQPMALAMDEEGHEHRGKGKGGGQFVSKGGGGSTGGSDERSGHGVGPGSGENAGKAARTGGAMEGAPARPTNEVVGGVGQGGDKPTGAEAPKDTRPAVPTTTQPRVDTASKERIDRIDRRMRRLANKYRNDGLGDAAEWIDDFRSAVRNTGLDRTIEILGNKPELKESEIELDPGEIVQYVASGELEAEKEEADFIKKYLETTGINIQLGDAFDPNLRTIAGAPISKDAKYVSKSGDVVPMEANIGNKLQESKMLPGLESTEDLSVIVGKKTTSFTPEVIDKLDERYGKDKWIVKSYGDESYAGFGVFFPQRVRQMQSDARTAILNVNRQLGRNGYTLARDDDGTIVGVKRKGDKGTVHEFGISGMNDIPDQSVRRLARTAARWAPSEKGVILPMSSEDQLNQEFGITMIKTSDGTPVGISTKIGRAIRFDSENYERFLQNDWDGYGYVIERARTWGNKKPNVAFMAQPAFEAVGVTEEERAEGNTFETSTEGRVHIRVKDGRASVVPYATLASRHDYIPVIIADDNIRAMEKAAQEAIDLLPKSERSNHVYAPDVMKTTEGWRVVELNPSSEFGSSGWIETNPLVIDSYVSHIVGREPAHVDFMRNLLRDRVSRTNVPTPSLNNALRNHSMSKYGGKGRQYGKSRYGGKSNV